AVKVKWLNILIAVGLIGAIAYKPVMSLYNKHQFESASTAVTKDAVVYGYDTWATGAVPFLGIDRGYQQDQHLKIATKFLTSDKDRFAALGKGDIHVTEISLPSLAVNSQEIAGGKYHDSYSVLAIADYSQGGDGLLVGPNVKMASQAELRGKRIGYMDDGEPKFLLSFLLRMVDLRLQDVKAQPFTDEAKLQQAFTSGQLDAVFYWQPGMGDLAKKVPGSRLLISTREMARLAPTVLIANREWAAANQDKVQQFVNFWMETIKHIAVDPTTAYSEMADSMNKVVGPDGKVYGDVNKDDVKRIFTDEIRLVSLDENAQTLGLNGAVEQLSETAAFTVDNWNKIQDMKPMSLDLKPQFIASIKSDPSFKPVTIDTAKGGTVAVDTTPKPKEFTQQQDASKLDPLAKISIPPIEFQPDSNALTDAGLKVINERVVPLLKQFPNLYILIDGHTDVQMPGDDAAYLMKLSQGRADGVKAMLIRAGFSPNQILAVGHGGTQPVNKQPKTDAEKQANRRTEFTLLTDTKH
ncbi:MAG: aliphatic sulfonates family transporter, periplasmic ligand-binding protein, partial [Firmicutes bacterium]|nr:aliphatic sulfonates family transporter, periplasmic ligand-binding protein [Bacillota bacterium]